ncbi:MAG: COG4315 family predicted lipoprotein [Ferrimicrobium sp.]
MHLSPRNLIPLTVTGVLGITLSACHFSNSSYGPASSGAPITNVNGPVGANANVGSTKSKLLGTTGAPKTASSYGGAGFPIPNYPPVHYKGYNSAGDPLYPVNISWRNSAYGPILTTKSGYTLYIRLGDEFRKSGCTGICLRAFPPELTNGAPQASSGILAADIGVLTANNSWEQASYGGHPLYRYRGDTAPGQINAEGKGSIWYVIGITGLPLLHKLVKSSGPSTAS